jgi:hypothetical protein
VLIYGLPDLLDSPDDQQPGWPHIDAPYDQQREPKVVPEHVAEKMGENF